MFHMPFVLENAAPVNNQQSSCFRLCDSAKSKQFKEKTQMCERESERCKAIAGKMYICLCNGHFSR